MENKVQKIKPRRTCTKKYSTHRQYKEYIKDDFNRRCGYCDDADHWMGGWRNFDIDHFKPQNNENFPEFKSLTCCYENLIYSCFYCNNAKSNKWKSADGFIDPCLDEYDKHLCRNDRGQIEYKTTQGKYIRKNLKLWLKRHELLWLMEKLNIQKEQLNKILKPTKDTEKLTALIAFNKIQNKIDFYYNLYKKEIE
jgi:hypothetical protein